jgi:hypothetical protein
VALKVLPAELAASPKRLERFRREAKALAAAHAKGFLPGRHHLRDGYASTP